MSIKCYWGSNGSYKSASSVEYDVIPELLKGRVVVTNVRGCTLDKCLEQYPDIPDTADLIYIDMSKPGSMDKMQTWFRWVPHGALIVIDEVQLVHRAAWRDRDLEKFILHVDDNGVSRQATFDEAERLGQPFDMLDAFTRHRHFNWDLVLTTPHIKYVRSDIRNTTEVCYRQANGALLGIKGRFKRSMHDADQNRPTPDSLTQTLSIKKKTFACYDSTTTGKAQDTRAGTNIFKSPRLLLALVCCFGAFFYAFSSGGFDKLLSAEVSSPDKVELVNDSSDNLSSDPLDHQVLDASSFDSVDHGLSTQSTAYANVDLITKDVFSAYDATITYFEGFSSGRSVYFLIEFDKWEESGVPFSLSSGQLLEIGYRFKWLSDCAVMLYTQKQTRLVTCWKPRPKGFDFDVEAAAAEVL